MPELQDYALIVGIDDYATFKPLKGAQRDARAFANFLRNKIDSRNIDPYMHPNLDDSPPARLDDLVKLVDKIVDLAKPGDRIGRRLWIFLAGHGATPDVEEVCFLSSEATEDRPRHIPGRFIANLFRGRALFQEVILCMDCCREYDREMTIDPPTFKKRLEKAAGNVKYCFMFATSFGSTARELDLENNNTHRGVFSRAVIDGLGGKAVDAQGRITSTSLFQYVRNDLAKLAPRGINQKISFDPLEDFVFFEGLSRPKTIVNLKLTDPATKFVILKADGKTIVDVPIEVIDESRRRFELERNELYMLAVAQPGGTFANPKILNVSQEQIDAEY